SIGWFTLPKTHGEYVHPHPANRDLMIVDFDLLLGDAANVAEELGGVKVHDFFGLHIVCLGDLAGSNWGMCREVTRGEDTKAMGVTWLPVTAFRSIHDVGHEMGHGFGLPHSEGADFVHTLQPSPWDIMSAGAFKEARPPFERLDVHLIAYQKRRLGWIEDERVITLTEGLQRVTLERLALPTNGGALMAPL